MALIVLRAGLRNHSYVTPQNAGRPRAPGSRDPFDRARAPGILPDRLEDFLEAPFTKERSPMDTTDTARDANDDFEDDGFLAALEDLSSDEDDFEPEDGSSVMPPGF